MGSWRVLKLFSSPGRLRRGASRMPAIRQDDRRRKRIAGVSWRRGVMAGPLRGGRRGLISLRGAARGLGAPALDGGGQLVVLLGVLLHGDALLVGLDGMAQAPASEPRGLPWTPPPAAAQKSGLPLASQTWWITPGCMPPLATGKTV